MLRIFISRSKFPTGLLFKKYIHKITGTNKEHKNILGLHPTANARNNAPKNKGKGFKASDFTPRRIKNIPKTENIKPHVPAISKNEGNVIMKRRFEQENRQIIPIR